MATALLKPEQLCLSTSQSLTLESGQLLSVAPPLTECGLSSASLGIGRYYQLKYIGRGRLIEKGNPTYVALGRPPSMLKWD